MNKPQQLKIGDKVAIVSLSDGILGEEFVSHELELGLKRLKEFGLEPVIMPNALKGVEFIKNHPELRADDLKQAFADESIKAILTAIGGFDTYRTLPYLLNDETFIKNVKNHPKIFLGKSDTTTNHLMFYQLGLNTFYGPGFLIDFAELDQEMLPYTKETFLGMFANPEIREIKSSPVWYEERTDFSKKSLGTKRIVHQETHGYEVLRGTGIVSGKLLGGCMDTLYSGLVGDNFPDQKEVFSKSGIFPSLDEWKDKIIFLEASDSHASLENYRKMIQEIAKLGIFDVAAGLIIGKPINEMHYEEYKQIWLEETSSSQIPMMYNLNISHAHPRTILPYGLTAKIDLDQKQLFIIEPYFNN